jgi:hypothetical protein
MSRRLIVNADDYGLSPGGAVLPRALSSTTVLANLVTYVARRASGRSLGAPLAAVTAGCSESAFNGWRCGRTNVAARLRREWRADRQTARAGLQLDHLDSHHHALLAPLFPLAGTGAGARHCCAPQPLPPWPRRCLLAALAMVI